MDVPRPFSSWLIFPPVDPVRPTVGYMESLNADLMWLLLTQLMQSPEKGRLLFAKPLANQNRLWIEFSNYVRQAKVYWDGARATSGSSAALFYYYAFLNLAKAELLTASPAGVYKKRIGHGLSFDPARSASLKGDYLKVVAGVFPMLYEKRIGQALTEKRLDVSRLLRTAREIALELDEVGFTNPDPPAPFYHTVVGDADKSWPLIATREPGFLLDPTHNTTVLFEKSFMCVGDELSRWKDTFALSRRALVKDFFVYQSRATFSFGTGKPDADGARKYLRTVMGPYVDDALRESAEGVLSPSLFKSRAVPMQGSLSRYVLMYYVSSLVRYKPSALDPARRANDAWLLDSFTKEAPLPLLASAYAGIVGRQLQFEGRGFRA